MDDLPQNMQAICLRRVPQGMPQAEDFELCSRLLPRDGEGRMLVRTRWLSLDPFLRAQLGGRYAEPCPLPGSIIPGSGIAEVVEDRSGRHPPGSLVLAATGWAEYAVVDASRACAVDTGPEPPTAALGVLGIPGLTAWAGVRRIFEPRPGQTILVSSAAGVVGSVAGQLCKAAGCCVVGISSSAHKCAIVTHEYGFDTCIDHRDPHFVEVLRQACPDGIDGYFDNVGGPVLEAALSMLRRNARVVLCGLIDQYNRAERPPGPNLGPVIASRARLEGLVVYDHLAELARCRAELGAMLAAGSLHYHEYRVHGLAAVPAAFIDLLRGEYYGKVLASLGNPA